MKRKSIFSQFAVVLFIALFLFAIVPEVFAQCPMCKASAESSIKEGKDTALGLNDGILYLLVFPYLLVATIGIIWYRHYRKQKALQANTPATA